MIDARVFDELSEVLGKLLPDSVSDVKDDFEQNARAAMQSALGKLELVTREEFDVQKEVLRNSRQQLKDLEHRIQLLEEKLDQPD